MSHEYGPHSNGGSKMVTVLVNPITKRPTAYEPIIEDAPRFYSGPYQNVTLVTKEWQAEELVRVYAVAAERERCARIAEFAGVWAGDTREQIGNGSPDAYCGYTEAAREIAARIRSGE